MTRGVLLAVLQRGRAAKCSRPFLQPLRQTQAATAQPRNKTHFVNFERKPYYGSSGGNSRRFPTGKNSCDKVVLPTCWLILNYFLTLMKSSQNQSGHGDYLLLLLFSVVFVVAFCLFVCLFALFVYFLAFGCFCCCCCLLLFSWLFGKNYNQTKLKARKRRFLTNRTRNLVEKLFSQLYSIPVERVRNASSVRFPFNNNNNTNEDV